MSDGVDVIQFFISTPAVFGICFLWVKFTEKAFKTTRDLWDAVFYVPKEKDRSDKEE